MNGWNRQLGCRWHQKPASHRWTKQKTFSPSVHSCGGFVIRADEQERSASVAASECQHEGDFFSLFFFACFFSPLPQNCVLKNMLCVVSFSSSVVFWVTHLWSFWRAVGTTARLSTLPMQTSERRSCSPSTRHTWATGGTWTPPRTSSEWSAWMG